MQWYKRSCASSHVVAATMYLWAVEPYTNRCTRVQIYIAARSMQLVRRGTALFTTDAVWWYFQKYCLQQTFYFITIPADKPIALAVVHCVKGHLYSAAGEVLWLHSIAPAEELCVKGHSPHSSPHPGPQLTGTSASGIPNLKNRLGQSWPEGLQTVFWYHYRVMSKGHVV